VTESLASGSPHKERNQNRRLTAVEQEAARRILETVRGEIKEVFEGERDLMSATLDAQPDRVYALAAMKNFERAELVRLMEAMMRGALAHFP
jgi:flagellar motor switch protein FliM